MFPGGKETEGVSCVTSPGFLPGSILEVLFGRGDEEAETAGICKAECGRGESYTEEELLKPT